MPIRTAGRVFTLAGDRRTSHLPRRRSQYAFKRQVPEHCLDTVAELTRTCIDSKPVDSGSCLNRIFLKLKQPCLYRVVLFLSFLDIAVTGISSRCFLFPILSWVRQGKPIPHTSARRHFLLQAGVSPKMLQLLQTTH